MPDRETSNSSGVITFIVLALVLLAAYVGSYFLLSRRIIATGLLSAPAPVLTGELNIRVLRHQPLVAFYQPVILIEHSLTDVMVISERDCVEQR